MPGQVPLQRKPAPARGPADGHAAAHGLNDAPRVAQLAGLGRALNAPKPARVANPVVQGYFLANPASGTARAKSHSTGPRPLHGDELHYPERDIAASAGRYRVSGDGTMAVDNTTGEPRNFFARNAVLNASNTALAATGSAVRLRKVGGQVVFPVQNTLPAIGPIPADMTGRDPNVEFQSLWTDICINFANHLIGGGGGSNESVVLENAQTGERSGFAMSPNGQGAPEINRLAETVTNPTATVDPQTRLDETRTHVTTGTTKPRVGRDYGRATQRGQTGGQEQMLGLNRHAHPEVGEGFATFTIASDSDKSLDYSRSKKAQERAGTWGYHHAAVVARSTDGKDWVTLENYRRTEQYQEALIPKVQARFRKVANKQLREIQKDKTLSKIQVREKLIEFLTQTHQGASTYYNSLLVQQKTPIAKLWFFRMYGSGHGQSFHEQQAASGGYLNPLTVRVRHDPSTKPLGTLKHVRGKMGALIAGVSWAGAKTALTGLAVDVSNMMTAINAPGPGRTSVQARNAVAQVRLNYANWLTTRLVPQMVIALNATRRNLPVVTATTIDQLKQQANVDEPAPGKMARFGNLLSRGDLQDANRKAALAKLKSAISVTPAELAD